MKFWLALLFSMTFCAVASAQTARVPGINANEIDRRATAMMQKSDMTGMAIAIVENGRVTFAKGYGEQVRGSGKAVDQNTIFRWASVSKGVAASTLLGLVEERRVDARLPIEALAPSLHLPPTSEKHDIVDLLSHRIGITRNAYDGRIEDGRDAKMLRTQLGGLNYVCPPRTCHTYQNVAFDAAAEIVEEATELPYKTVVQREVFDPLGMSTASLTLDAMVHSRNWARPHNRKGRLIRHIKSSYYHVPAAAGVNSSVVDLARWMTALMPNKPGMMPTTPFPTERLMAMQTRVVATPGEQRMMDRSYGALDNSHYGLGLRIYDYHGHKVVGHRGGVEGYRSLILFDPEKQSGIAIMWNSPHGQPIGLQMEFMDQLYGLPKRDWLRLGQRRS
ncbi:serine hydrolase domain-containing protein [Algimonas ampicilliniresistens]|nr:serine hydrolase domain-containing protein [Algimonas ampicilliniresistens]